MENKFDKEMRQIYCDALIKEAEKNDKIVVVDCDLSLSLGTGPFVKRFPEKSLNFGIAEANAFCACAGMSTTGMIPFFNSLAVFSSRRIADQVFLSGCYSNTNVKVIGGDSGIFATKNGGTHMAFEDIGVLRSFPNLKIIEPSDNVSMSKLIPLMANTYGMFYMRFARRNNYVLYSEDEEFILGKAKMLKRGKDLTIIASGITVKESLEAAELLKKDGYDVEVVDMWTIKPLDEEMILESAKKTNKVLVTENHNVLGGVGSAVAELLAEKHPVPVYRMGINDEFGEVGSLDFLYERYKLRAIDIYQKALEILKK